MTPDIRREAEALWEKLNYHCDDHLDLDDLNDIVAFATAQRAKEVEAFEQRIAEHHAKDHWYFKSIKLWLTQRKQELEA